MFRCSLQLLPFKNFPSQHHQRFGQTTKLLSVNVYFMIVCFNFQAGQGNFQELVQQARTRPETQPGTRRDRHRARRSSQGKEGRRHQAARNWASPCYW